MAGVIPVVYDITFHKRAKTPYYTIDVFKNGEKVRQIGGKFDTYEKAYEQYEWIKRKFYGEVK